MVGQVQQVQQQAGSFEAKVARLRELQVTADPARVAQFRSMLELSWIYHDSSLEGVVYNETELQAALAGERAPDNQTLSIYEEIRNHKVAIDMMYEAADNKRGGLSLEVIKKIYAQLAPEELEGRGQVTYRKDMPLHRLYFHEISTPDKIPGRMRQIMTWANAPETKRSMHPVRLAAKLHFQLMQTYPFPRQTGKVARLAMNLMLIRAGYPPAIIHATSRQRYYDALKTSDEQVAKIVNMALASTVESAVKFLEMKAD